MSYPITMHTITTEAFKRECFSFGSGSRPFVILPGVSVLSIMPSAEALVAGFADFAALYRVYVFDRPADLKPGTTLRDMAEAIAVSMKKLGLADADVFGASQGGMIAQLLAIDHPELVHKLVLGGTASRLNDISRAVLKEWIRLADGDDIRALNRGVTNLVYSEYYRRTYREAFNAIEGLGTPEDMRQFALSVSACLTLDSYDRLDRIACPVLVAGSTGDHVLTGKASVELAEKLGCECQLYDRYGHAVYDEAPDFRPRMLAFLQNDSQ